MPTHYQVLSLPSPDVVRDLDASTIRRAYHKTLLRCHPDKVQAHEPGENVTQHAAVSARLQSRKLEDNDKHCIYTIDRINTAYAIVSNSVAKYEYDALLAKKLGETVSKTDQVVSDFRTGLETVDLDDLLYDSGCFTRDCRCGQEQGYVLTEEEMEDLETELDKDGNNASNARAMIVGCAGCSLWLKVEWLVVSDEKDSA